MKKLNVIIMHKLPNRVRLKLSEPIKSFETFKENVTKDGESIELKYTPVTRSIVATFNPEKVNLQEAIYKILTAFSIENGMMPVKLLEGVEQKAIESFAIYSGASIVMSGINMLINRNDEQLQNIMNWFSISMTSAAILEHACHFKARNSEELLRQNFDKTFCEECRIGYNIFARGGKT